MDEDGQGTHLSNVEGPCMRPPPVELDGMGGMFNLWMVIELQGKRQQLRMYLQNFKGDIFEYLTFDSSVASLDPLPQSRDSLLWLSTPQLHAIPPRTQILRWIRPEWCRKPWYTWYQNHHKLIYCAILIPLRHCPSRRLSQPYD